MKKSLFTALAVVMVFFAFLCAGLFGEDGLAGAFESGDTGRILKLLADKPDQLKADMGDGMTPLHYGVYYGYEAVVDYALKNGLDINMKDGRGLPPVWFSVSGNRPAMLRKLIALGADLGAKNQFGDNLLFRAASTGNLELFNILLDNGFKIDEKNANGWMPVVNALRANSVDIARLYAAKGVDLKAVPMKGMSLLHQAVMSRRAEAVHYLLDLGFPIDVMAEGRGATPLLFAMDFNNPDAARALVLRGADVNTVDANGQTPLLLAVKKNHGELVDLFIKKGANTGFVDPRTGKTLLHEAALRGYSKIAGSLVASGLPIDARDGKGRTALSYALKHGNRTAAEVLRAKGAADVPGETIQDDAVLLNQPLKKGEASIWYLRHSGWAIKTPSAFLIFDYWRQDPDSDEKALANGRINPESLKGLPVYVFVSHGHGDHFDRQILEWKKTNPNITYIFGFEPGAGEGGVSLAPRVQKTIGPLTVTTIQSNDEGVGFAVQVDGLTIFHAGDHSNNKIETADNDFFPEIDFLAGKGIKPDIAFFLNMYGCGSTNPEAFQKGIFYAVDKLKIKSVFPMHGADKEWVYGYLSDGVAKAGTKVQVGAAVNQGDRFFFSKGKLS